MYCLGRNQENDTSVLADFAYSNFDGKHIGRKSDPHMIRVEAGALEKVSFASHNAVARHVAGQFTTDGQKVAAVAPLPYFWHLINNTATYRLYETFVQSGLHPKVAHLHTGDDYRYYHPIVADDLIAVTCELTRLYDREGRQGPMRFIEDLWQFRNQDNVLVGELVRKAVTVRYVTERKPAKMGTAPDVKAEVPAGRFSTIGPVNDRPYQTAALFDSKLSAYEHDIGPVTWTMMIQWMGAVDDYSRTHYDWDYAKERDFPGGIPIVAGPHMGALMLAPVSSWIGPDAWVEEFNHIQRHPVHPNDRLTTVGITRPLGDDKDRIRIEAWLLNEDKEVVNWADFLVCR